MCICLSEKLVKCKLAPNKQYCHIHKRPDLKLKHEVRTLNQKLKDMKEQFINLNELSQRHLANADKAVDEMNNIIKKQSEENEYLNMKLSWFKNDIDQFNKVKRFERIKKNIGKFINTENQDEIYYFFKQRAHKEMLSNLLDCDKNHFDVYDGLRQEETGYVI